jgi:anti-sigma regulatory factor (Ser/Thr protein kinase)
VDEVRLQLKRSADSPREARHALREWLDTVACPDGVREGALLVVSELVTNAIVHARSEPVVVGTFGDGMLRIEVHDDDRSPPLVAASSGPTGGFGMRLVAAVSDAWGWAHTDSGKRVWAETLC